MELWEIFVIGVALSMDAVAASLTDGMAEPGMPHFRAFLIAGTFGFFQFLMPVLGYYAGYAFTSLVEKIAPWLSFGLLLFVGGKMIVDCILEMRKKDSAERAEKNTGAAKILIQGIATSIDALAVGVTMLAAETGKGLPLHVVFCSLIIGAVTFLLSVLSVYIGKRAGARLADKAEIVGGVILIAIGVKLLVESFF